MSNIRNLLIAALLANTANAVAASSVDLTVKGSITPSACTPSLTNGGVVDYGKLSAKDLRYELHTRLERQYMQLRVTCDAPTLIALLGKDNRSGSEYFEGDFGLGLINGDQKLGSFHVVLESAVADGTPARFIFSNDNGSTWNESGGFWQDSFTSVANHTSLTPMPVQVLTGEMTVFGIITPARELTLTNEVPIDGSATLTIKYL